MPISFTDTEKKIHKICRDRGWAPDTFYSLTDAEQIDLLAYEIYRQTALQELLNQMGKKRPLSKTKITETSSLTPETLAILMIQLL